MLFFRNNTTDPLSLCHTRTAEQLH